MKILAVGAHPDDIEIGCGGTEATLIARGAQAIHLVMTSGESGSAHSAPEGLAALREREARAAAEVLGASRVEFLRGPDGFLREERALKLQLISLIRAVRPDLVFVHASHDRFPDHRATHALVMGALGGAAGPWFSEAGGRPHQVRAVYGYEVWEPLAAPQAQFDVTEFMSRKLGALRCHQSQLVATKYDEAVTGLARYRGALGTRTPFAEAFEVLRTEVLPC